MKGKKLFPIVVLVLLVALAAIGVGYAVWDQSLTVNGTAATGKLEVQWDAPTATAIDTAGMAGYGPVGACSAWRSGSTIYDNLNIAISNGYPGFRCVVTAGVNNTGTVPAVVTADPTNMYPDINDAVVELYGSDNWSPRTLANGGHVYAANTDYGNDFRAYLQVKATAPEGYTIDSAAAFTFGLP